MKNSVTNKAPYVSQFATPEFAEKILRDKVLAEHDLAWKNTGAVSPEEYSAWVLTQCGMACTLMALQYFKKEHVPIVLMANDALAHGVYQREQGRTSDMRYGEYVTWIRNYSLHAELHIRLSIRGIQYALSRGRLVMVSVNPNIRGYETAAPAQRGGHLVLITGYDKSHNTITFINPSGFTSTHTQIAHTLPISEFLSYYAGRGILVSI